MINLIITFYSLVNGIDPSVSFQLAKVESGLNPNAYSKTQDGGLFQLNSKYYRFHNPKWIFRPETNIALAMHTLSKFRKNCKHKLNNTYILCYNLGNRGASKIKNPLSQTYYKKNNLIWRHQ